MGQDHEQTVTNYAERLGKVESEVHNIGTTVSKLFDKFDQFVEKVQPKQMSLAGILGLLATLLGILALLFGSVIYISTSSNAPLMAQSAQMVSTMQAMQRGMGQNTNLIQLTSKDVSGLSGKVSSNEETLRWLLFEENIPKQLTELRIRQEQIEQLLLKKGR